MDEDRRIRFLIAPTLFVASLLIGVRFDDKARDYVWGIFSQAPAQSTWSNLIGIVAGGGLLVFVAGYVIGTFTYFVLRFWFRYGPRFLVKSRFHEVSLSQESFRRIWRTLRAPAGEPDPWQELFAGAAFDHGILHERHNGIHRWLFRRWNAFSIATTSFCGLGLSLLFGHLFFGISFSPQWLLFVGVFAAVLVPVIWWAWHDTMGMLNFMANLPNEPGTVAQPGKNAS